MTLPDRHAAPNSPPPFRADAHEVDTAAVVRASLELLAAGQGADRGGVRLIRALRTRDGLPVLNARGEQQRAILAGVFQLRDLGRLSEQIAELNGRAIDDPRDNLGLADAVGGWDCYAHAQRVGAPLTGRLLPGRMGTVRGEGIAAYTTLVADIDPQAGAEPGVALYVAGELTTVLVEIGVPRGAIMLMQSGRGAYVLIAVDPQPLAARETMRLATQTLARLIAAAEEPVHGDEAVFDAPRILRIAGTTNHKVDADPATPAWILQPWTPGVRAPWAVIEKLASKSRPKLRTVPATSKPNQPADPRRPLRDLFQDRGWIYRERADGICDVRCPNAEQHTDGRDAAILYPPRDAGGPGWLKCSHAHCANLTLFDVYRLLGAR